MYVAARTRFSENSRRSEELKPDKMLFHWLFILVIDSFEIICLGVPLNEFIQNFEPVYYSKDELLKEHHIAKRSVQKNLNLKFSSYDRLFELDLTPDVYLFTGDVLLETGTGSLLDFDKSKIYSGSLKGEYNSSVHGVLTEEGMFDGKIRTTDDEFIVEPVQRYLQHIKNEAGSSLDFHSIIYKVSEVKFPYEQFTCGYGSKTSDWMQKVLMEAKPIDQPTKRRKRYDELNTCCTLNIVADHTFLERHGSIITVVEQVILHVQEINVVFPTIDFNLDGVADNITFAIKHLTVYTAESLMDPSYPLSSATIDESHVYIHAFSAMENYDDYCLSIAFTNRDFSEGVLGVAWLGQPGDESGGICQKRKYEDDQLMNKNTAFITVQNNEEYLPTSITYGTFTHEVGHSFGAHHDTLGDDECVPEEEDGGYYLMYPYAMDGNDRNNRRFSPCSIASMNAVITADAIGETGCFIEHPISICGNGVLDIGEECDCGYAGENGCWDDCCYPMRETYDTLEGTPCTLKSHAVCSPASDVCCSKQCNYYNSSHNILCISGNQCVDDAYCTDDGVCPEPVFQSDGTPCEGDMICMNGLCSRSICVAHGMERCLCKGEDQLCHVCCLEDHICKSTYEIGSVPDTMAQRGRPCNGYKGYCNQDHECIEVKPQIELTPVILQSPSILQSYWWAIILIVVIAALIIVVVLYVLKKKYDASNIPPSDHNLELYT